MLLILIFFVLYIVIDWAIVFKTSYRIVTLFGLLFYVTVIITDIRYGHTPEFLIADSVGLLVLILMSLYKYLK